MSAIEVTYNFGASDFTLKKGKQHCALSLLVYNKTELDLQVNKESMFTNQLYSSCPMLIAKDPSISLMNMLIYVREAQVLSM